MEDQIKGCFAGCIIGDALGVPHELKCHINNVYTGLLYIEPEFKIRLEKPTKNVIGQYSDDTEMTLCIIRSIISNHKYDKKDIIDRYMKWANCSRAIGKNTKILFQGVTTIDGHQSRWNQLYLKTDVSTWSQSNGCLMRCSPLAFLTENEVIEDCKITNPHYVTIYSCLVLTRLIKNQIIDLTGICKEVKDVVEEALHSEKFTRDITINKGFVLNSLYCAVWAWKNFDVYQDAIDFIIRQKGDTDTNAAITGALMGSKLGFRKMMQEERTFENFKIIKNADFTKGDMPREKEYLIDDFDKMVEDFTFIVCNM